MGKFRHTLRRFRGQARQLSMSGLAVAVGVAFLILAVGGAQALTDGFRQTITSEIGSAPVQVIDSRGDGIPPESISKVRATPGVAGVTERITGHSSVIGTNGRPLDEESNAVSIAADPGLRWQRLGSGQWATGPGQIMLDGGTAGRLDAKPGATVTLSDTKGGTKTAELTGILDTSGQKSLSGKSVIGIPQAQLGDYAARTQVDQLDVSLTKGAEAGAVTKALNQTLDVMSHRAQTHAETESRAEDQGNDAYIMLLTAVISFVLIAMAVARMVVSNTFAVVVAHQTRQLALLRLIGATQSQVRAEVLRQGVLLGVVASLGGVALGLGLALAGNAVLGVLDLGFIKVSLLPPLWALIVAPLFGLGLTMLAVRGPAQAAGGISPIAALSGALSTDVAGGKSRRSTQVTAAMLVVGGALIGVSAVAENGGILYVTLGGIIAFFGILRVTPWVLPPVVRVIGLPFRKLFGTTGHLAVQQLRASPRRTAAAASALLVGVTMMVSAATAMGVASASAESLVQGDSPGAFRLKAPGDAVPAAAVKAVRDSKELRSVPVWQATVKTEGDTQDHRKLIAVAKESGFGRYVDEAGRIPAGSAVPEAWRAGPLDTTVVAADGTRHVLRGGGESSLITKLSDSGDFVVSPDTLRSLVPDPAVATLWIDPAGGKDTKAARKVLDKVLMPFPEVRVEAGANQAEYYRDLIQKAGLVVGVLLGFSLLIAALGIATTLTLSVSERTREIGVLRAIGLTGQQLKRMLTLEAVLLALTGALAGTVLGLAFGWFAGRSLMPNAPVVFDPPYLVILGLLALTVLIGLAASVLPARRIRRMPVVDALAEQ